MAAVAIAKDEMVNLIVTEMARGVDAAVECWMAQIDEALTDIHLTTLGKMNAVKDVLFRYKALTGKQNLKPRSSSIAA
jgi:hypothetical protein